MTTILWDADEGLVACDTAGCIDSLIHPYAGVGKIRLINDESNLKPKEYKFGPRLYVYAGMMPAGISCIATVRDVEMDGGNSEFMFSESPEDLEVNLFEFRLDIPGYVLRYDGYYVPSVMIPIGLYALGSGSHLALGAREAGATMKEAIDIAIKHDTSSGGIALVFDLNNEELLHGHELVGDAFTVKRDAPKKKAATKRKKKPAAKKKATKK